MTEGTLYFSYLLAFGTALMQAGLLVIVLSLIFRKASWSIWLRNLLAENAFVISFFLAIGGTITSLIYSEFFGFPPCNLCWWQRILLYPQVVILGFGVALQNKRATALYSVIFSIAGLLVALYQVVIQAFPIEDVFCSVDITGVDCAEVIFRVWGYMTIPVMSATSFGMIAILSLLFLSREKVSWYAKFKEIIKIYI